MSRFASRWWWAFALPLAACAFAGLYDWRWAVAVLMLLFIAYPFAMLLAYYSIALTKQNALTMLPQTATFTPAGVTLTYSPYDDEWARPDPTCIHASEIIETEQTGKDLQIKTDKLELCIPLTAFKSDADRQKALNWLPNHKKEVVYDDF